jgi:hypothetical protein
MSGRRGETGDEIGTIEAEIAVQHQLAVAGLEEPGAGCVGGEPGLAQGDQPAQEPIEIEGTAEGTNGLGQERAYR